MKINIANDLDTHVRMHIKRLNYIELLRLHVVAQNISKTMMFNNTRLLDSNENSKFTS